LLTVTDENLDSKRTNERVPPLVGSLGLSCRYKRFLSCLCCFSRTGTKYCFASPYTISMPLFPSHRQAGRQPCWVVCLLVCVSIVTLVIYILPKVNSAHRTPEENMNNAFLQLTLSESKLSKMNYWPNFSHFYRGSIDLLPGGGGGG
jgi:hypothetical protein